MIVTQLFMVMAGGCARVALPPSQTHLLRLLLMVSGAAGVIACDGVTEPAPNAITISLSAASVTLQPGVSEQVVVSVVPPVGGVRLTLAGLQSGISATLSPEFLSQGETQSTLTVAAVSGTRPGETTLTIGAVAGGAGASGGMTQATVKLLVRVPECPGYAIPSNCPPFPTGGTSFISGVVLERSAAGTRPIGGAAVWAWVQYANGNGYSAGRVQTDANGEYRFPNLPDALVLLQTAGGGYDQPCASFVQLAGPSGTANLEVVSAAAPIVDAEPPPPALVGVVYEMTASGRQPVPGARVFFETLFEVVAATTTTDQLGRYSLCRLPSLNSFVTPVKAGYITTGRAVSVSEVVQLDIEMKRQ